MRWTNMEVYYLVAVVTMKQLLEAESTSGIKPEDGIPRWRPTFIWSATVYISSTFNKQ